MPKVYCEQCRNYKGPDNCPNTLYNIQTNQLREICLAPENYKDTHEEADALPLSIPRVINRFNNCKWYDAIEPDSSSTITPPTGECSFIVDMP